MNAATLQAIFEKADVDLRGGELEAVNGLLIFNSPDLEVVVYPTGRAHTNYYSKRKPAYYDRLRELLDQAQD